MEFNYLHVVIVTHRCYHEATLLYFPTAKKSVENEGIQGKSIAIVTF